MKVLALTPLFLPHLGGIEVLVDGVAGRLRRQGIETVIVTELTAGLPEFEVVNGTRVHRLALSAAIRSREAAAPLAVLKRLAETLSAERPDIVHLHSASQAGAFYLDRVLGKLPDPIPLLITQHGVLEQEDQLAVVRRLLRRAAAITAVSRAALDSAVAFAQRGGDLRVIPNGIGAHAGPHSPAPPEAGDLLRFLCVGRLQLEKGFDIAIEALAGLRDAGRSAELTIVGRGPEGRRLAALAEDLGVGELVHFRGELPHDEVLREMALSHLLLAPSRTREGFGLVVAEAALAGIPAIVSSTGGLPETVESRVTGFVVPPNDAAAVTAAMVALFGQPGRWAGMSRAARERAARRFDLEQCARSYARLFADHATVAA